MGRVGRVSAAIALIGFAAGCGDNTPISFNHPEASDNGASSATWCGRTGGSVGDDGGSLDCLSFAVVGDTRPPTIDDTANYPSAVIGRIYEDLESESPRPAFGITTGDYQFARPSGNEAAKQIDLYLQAQSAFTNPVFHAMGNHECTGATDSNCAGQAAQTNRNFAAFMSKMLQPSGHTLPYYSWKVAASDGSWTAKFVVIAANAWDAAQASWLDQVLSDDTTYTFVIRHEADYANTAPGVTPSGKILSHHKYTLLLVGHTHTFDWIPGKREMVVGIGGAPLTSSSNYGYVVGRQRSDGAMQFTVYDYQSHAALASFAVDANGSVVPTISGAPSPTPSPAPSHSPSPTPTATPSGTPQELVTNGAFEGTLAGWTLGGVKSPIDSSAQAHGGTKSLRVGATTTTDVNGDSWAYQDVAIPAGASATLSFWSYAASADTLHDWQAAEIRDASGATLATIFRGGDDSRTWTRHTVDLSTHAGHTVRLWFGTMGNGDSLPTTLWVDDVSVEAP